ncbi:MAG: quinone oxidoreductase family protein [Candidatus Kariarchaeaceae archaeon]
MKAVVLEKSVSSQDLTVTEVDQPQPEDDEVLIKVKYSGVNYADILSRKGLYSWAGKRPYIMGLEAAGEVVETGKNVSDVEIGDRLVYGGQSGGYAEYLTVNQEYVLPAPENYTWEECAGFGVTFFTAWVAMHEMARVRPGETMLVHSAAGGVGTAAIQLGRVHGMQVFGTASQPHKRAKVEELGATAFSYDDFDTRLNEMEIRPDMVLETVGGDVYRRSFDLLAPMGRTVLVGASSIKVNKWNPLSLYRAYKALPSARMSQVLRRSRGFMGVHLGYMLKKPDILKPSWERMLEVIAEHDLHPEIDRVFPMSKVGEAHDWIDNRHNIGKVLLDPTE